MRKDLKFYILGSLFLLGLSSCSDDDYANRVLGVWELEKSYFEWNAYEIGADEVILDFEDGGVLKVRSISTQLYDQYFLPTGNYHYTITADTLFFQTDNGMVSKWGYSREGNMLEIYYYIRIMDQNVYPASAHSYSFHIKE